MQEIAEALTISVEQLDSDEQIDESQIVTKELQKERFYTHLLDEIEYLKSIVNNQLSIIQALSKK